MATTPTPTRNKRAASQRLANPQNKSSDNQTHIDIHQDISKKLDHLLHVLTDLSMRVAAVEVRQDQGQASVMASPPTSHPRRRARHQVIPAPYDEKPPNLPGLAPRTPHLVPAPPHQGLEQHTMDIDLDWLWT